MIQFLRKFSSDCGRDHAQGVHQFMELLGIERLRSIRKGLVRVVMNLDQQHISASGDGSARHGRNFVAKTGTVGRIRSHGQVGKLVNDGNGADIERVARVSFKSTNAPLAKNYVVVAAGHNIFGREQKFFDGGSDPAFEQRRLLNFAEFAQQIEILHVAGAHLKNVDVGKHLGNLRNLHHLADYQQVELIFGLAQKFKSLNSKALK